MPDRDEFLRHIQKWDKFRGVKTNDSEKWKCLKEFVDIKVKIIAQGEDLSKYELITEIQQLMDRLDMGICDENPALFSKIAKVLKELKNRGYEPDVIFLPNGTEPRYTTIMGLPVKFSHNVEGDFYIGCKDLDLTSTGSPDD